MSCAKSPLNSPRLPSTAQPQLLRERWILACIAGEILGFGLFPVLLGSGVIYALSNQSQVEQALGLYIASIFLGFAEGAVLASFQYTVLVRALPQLPRVLWVTATGFAAATAWALGMLQPTLDALLELPTWLSIVLWVVAALLVLPIIGVAQAYTLHRASIRGGRHWIGYNVAAWLSGLPWTVVAPSLLPDDSPTWHFAIALVAGGVLMAISFAVVTSFGLGKLGDRSTDNWAD